MGDVSSSVCGLAEGGVASGTGRGTAGQWSCGSGGRVACCIWDPGEHRKVDAFAKEWGFINKISITLNSIDGVRDFTTTTVGLAGEWNNEPVEGFVVRTHVTPTGNAKLSTASPYVRTWIFLPLQSQVRRALRDVQ